MHNRQRKELFERIGKFNTLAQYRNSIPGNVDEEMDLLYADVERRFYALCPQARRDHQWVDTLRSVPYPEIVKMMSGYASIALAAADREVNEQNSDR